MDLMAAIFAREDGKDKTPQNRFPHIHGCILFQGNPLLIGFMWPITKNQTSWGVATWETKPYQPFTSLSRGTEPNLVFAFVTNKPKSKLVYWPLQKRSKLLKEGVAAFAAKAFLVTRFSSLGMV